MSLVLATRLPWLEAPLGGMDRVYRSHKWAGILACAFAALYWLVEMSSDLLKAVIGRQGRVPKEKFNGLPRLPARRPWRSGDLFPDQGAWRLHPQPWQASYTWTAGACRGAVRAFRHRAPDFSSGGVCHALGWLPLCRNRSRKPHFTAGARLVYQ